MHRVREKAPLAFMEKHGVYARKTETLEGNIETIFHSMVERKDFEDAVNFIDNCVNKVPHYTVLRATIFDIIMDKDCDAKAAIAANSYLHKILTIYPPSDKQRRLYYKGALTSGNNLFLDIWAAFCHFVESSFCHHKIFIFKAEDNEDGMIKPIQHPNCDILIDFYVKVLHSSFEYFSSERSIDEKNLVTELFWPSLETGASCKLSAGSSNPRRFLGWINNIYESMARIEKIGIFKTLHQLLNLMVKCIVTHEFIWGENEVNNHLPDALICNHTNVLEIVKIIMNACPEAFISHDHLRRFMNHITLKYLRIKICEFKLNDLIRLKQSSSPTTLKYIINMYMFPTKLLQKRGRKSKKQKKPIEGKDNPPKLSIKYSKKGETSIQEACWSDKPADLFQILHSSPVNVNYKKPDVNHKNESGYTALHIVCVSGSFLCAKVLIEECTSETAKQKLDWIATDADGVTPLHIAVHQNHLRIVKLMVKEGGSQILDLVDKFGHKPWDYASTKEMQDFFREYQSSHRVEIKTNQPIDLISNYTIPTNLRNFKDYALYFHALQFLLAYYSDIFHIFELMELIRKDQSEYIKVYKHEDKVCPHFVMCEEVHAICSEDFEYLPQLPNIVNHFIDCAVKLSEEKELSLDLELLPLQLYAATLNS